MTEYTLILLFIPIFLMVSATPGMCMTLAFTLGLRYGIRKALWMMLGELAGVAIVSVSAVMGVSRLMLNYPSGFLLLKIIGGLYLFYVAWKMWISTSSFHSQKLAHENQLSPSNLITQGFVTAISNPKGWAFTVSLLPSFIDAKAPLMPQLIIMVTIILCSEFLFMMIYATGGKKLGHFLKSDSHLVTLNRVVAILIASIGLWLFLDG